MTTFTLNTCVWPERDLFDLFKGILSDVDKQEFMKPPVTTRPHYYKE